MKNKYNLFSYIITISFIVFSFFFSIHFCCFDESFYSKQHNKIMLYGKHINEHIGISNEQLEELTSFTLDYLNDPKASLDKQMVIKSELREVFTDDEKAHMVDVRNLNLIANGILIVSTSIFLLSLVIYICYKMPAECLYDTFKKVIIRFLIIFGMLALWIFIDFNSFWTIFHKIFFVGNDLWILDLRKDILIMIVPPEFFNNLVIRIILYFAILNFLFFSTLNFIYNRKRKIND